MSFRNLAKETRSSSRENYKLLMSPVDFPPGVVRLSPAYPLSPAFRRDIWFGEDMAGEGKRRSEWNSLLLRDVIAPIYASLVSIAREVKPKQTAQANNNIVVPIFLMVLVSL